MVRIACFRHPTSSRRERLQSLRMLHWARNVYTVRRTVAMFILFSLTNWNFYSESLHLETSIVKYFRHPGIQPSKVKCSTCSGWWRVLLNVFSSRYLKDGRGIYPRSFNRGQGYSSGYVKSAFRTKACNIFIHCSNSVTSCSPKMMYTANCYSFVRLILFTTFYPVEREGN